MICQILGHKGMLEIVLQLEFIFDEICWILRCFGSILLTQVFHLYDAL